jgi:23S rRNA pseudouridine1911/1915/1917 synthase
VDFENGKAAKTRFTVQRHAGDFTVLKAYPSSGRTNQIRVHLDHIGHPLVGDRVYGLAEPLRDELLCLGPTARVRRALILDRHALHARALRFNHPATNAPMVLRAPIPQDLAPWVRQRP